VTVKVRLHNPKREIEIDGPITIVNLLGRLGLHRDAVLVIRDGELVPGDATLAADDSIEVRPVISGGAS
jgi:sulfur carrier protein